MLTVIHHMTGTVNRGQMGTGREVRTEETPTDEAEERGDTLVARIADNDVH